MQQENKNDSVQLSSRYQQYTFAKQHLRGTSRPEVFPISESSGWADKEQLQKQTTSQSVENITDHKSWRRHAVLTPDRPNKRQNGRRFKENGEPSFTLTAQDRHGVYDGVSIRRLTPTECMRLQGFPDDWCDVGADGKLISDCQKYKMAGNAVTVNVVKEIIKRLI